MKKFLKLAPYFLIVLLLGVYIGLKVGNVFSITSKQAGKIGEILNYTAKYYVDTVNSQTLTEDAIRGMFSDLDPHTVYIPASEQATEEETFRGNFEGIGVEFQIMNDTITVVSPITGGPSETVGILSGDRFVKIDGKSCIGWKNQDVIKKLRGSKGTKVSLTIFRPSLKKVIEFIVVREKINLYSILL